MLKRNPIIVAALALISLCGCASTPPTEIGANTYYAAKTNTAGAFGNPVAVAGNLMAEGNRFCAAKGLEFQLVTQTIMPPRVLASLGGASITFKCVKHAGAVVMRPDKGISTIQNKQE
jgi:hypothetical protein